MFAAQLGPDADLPDWTAPPPPPGVVPLRPLTVGDILGGAFRAVRFNPPSMMGMTLVLMLGIQLLAALVALAANAGAAGGLAFDFSQLTNFLETGDGAIAVATGFGLVYGGNWLGTFLATAMLAYVVCEGVAGRRVKPREAVHRLWQRLGATLAYGLLMLLATTLIIGLGAGSVIAMMSSNYDGSGVGALILLTLVFVALPVAWVLSVKLSFTVPAIAVEGLRPFAAIRRSWALTRGRFWRTFGIQFLASVIAQIAASVISQVLSIVGLIISTDNPTVAMVGVLAVSLLASMLTLPLVAGVTALVYTDARIRGEGLDIELAEALAR